jgi:putative transcriptional regulator
VNVQERLELGQKDRPVDELLAAYAAGSLSAPLVAVMDAHLEFKPAQRAFVAALEAAFGIMLEDIEPVPLTNRDRRLVEIFASDDAQKSSSLPLGLNGASNGSTRGTAGGDKAGLNGQKKSNGKTNGAKRESDPLADDHLPVPLLRFVGLDLDALTWRSAGSGIRQSLAAAGSFGEAIVMHLQPGKRMPAHGHHGLEVMLVLKGVLSDGDGQYRRGDLCVADETVEHQPIAGPDQDCLVFIVRTAPLKVGTMDRMIQMLLGR